MYCTNWHRNSPGQVCLPKTATIRQESKGSSGWETCVRSDRWHKTTDEPRREGLATAALFFGPAVQGWQRWSWILSGILKQGDPSGEMRGTVFKPRSPAADTVRIYRTASSLHQQAFSLILGMTTDSYRRSTTFSIQAPSDLHSSVALAVCLSWFFLCKTSSL